ncbi:hypothetical protein GCM10027186_37390 [Micromonospora schwarzwaldensis]
MSDDVTTPDGGAPRVTPAAANFGRTRLTDSTARRNHGQGDGGGIADGGVVEVAGARKGKHGERPSLSDDHAGRNGGGIFNNKAAITLTGPTSPRTPPPTPPSCTASAAASSATKGGSRSTTAPSSATTTPPTAPTPTPRAFVGSMGPPVPAASARPTRTLMRVFFVSAPEANKALISSSSAATTDL